MPQMMPMKWLLIFMMTLILLMFTIYFLYFIFLIKSSNMTSNFYIYNPNKWLWKW